MPAGLRLHSQYGRQRQASSPSDKICLGFSFVFVPALSSIQIVKPVQTTVPHAGVYNATAPNPERNKVLAKKIAEAKKQSALLLPVPAFALKLAMGEMSAIVLDSANVQPKRLLAEGFEFKFPDLKEAIEDLLARGL